MCGRYTLFTEKEQRELYKIIKDVDDKLNRRGQPLLHAGEIFPTNTAPILMNDKGSVSAEAAVWGFPKFQGKGVIINARAETAPEKPMFSKAYKTMRCVIPSAGFYEWNRTKTKYLFQKEDTEILFMAGLTFTFNQTLHFVVLTTNANESMNEIHDRMPVTLESVEIDNWIFDDQFAKLLLQRMPAQLIRYSDDEQLSFG